MGYQIANFARKLWRSMRWCLQALEKSSLLKVKWIAPAGMLSMRCFVKIATAPTLGKRLICVTGPLLIETIVNILTERLCKLVVMFMNVGKV